MVSITCYKGHVCFGRVCVDTSVPRIGMYNVFLTVGHCQDTPLGHIPDGGTLSCHRPMADLKRGSARSQYSPRIWGHVSFPAAVSPAPGAR